MDIWIVAALSLSTLILTLFVMKAFLRRRYEHAASGTTAGQNGWTTVPLVAAFSGWRFLPWWLATATNSANPKLEISAEAIRYRTISLHTRPIGDIELVDIHTSFGTVSLRFLFHGSLRTFSANLGTAAAAADALRLLPPSVAISEASAALLRQ